MTQPFFSVVTPSFQQGRFIAGCLGSVASQDDPGYEQIVLDNCSTDNTASEVARFPGVRFLQSPDRGQSDALNKGFQMAEGEVICWLNSDDYYPTGLFKKLRGIFSDPSIQVVFGDVLQVGDSGAGEVRAPARFHSRLDMIRWWSGEVKLHQPAIFFRRSVRESVGLLREDLHYAMDYEYWWRMSENHSFHYVPEVLAVQIRQPDSKTIRSWPKVYDDREKIFSPFYGLIDGGNRAALLREKHCVLARRFLGEAFAAAPKSPREAARLLMMSFREHPASILNPGWLGVLRRMVQ